jgi:hypothetical protein
MMTSGEAMTTRWFPSALKTAEAPPGMRIYAIGDIHGRADLLHVLAEAIVEDLAARAAANRRSPSSSGTMSTVALARTVF